MAVEQRIILGAIDCNTVYQSCVRSGENIEICRGKKDKQHPLVGRVYRFRLKSNAELNAEFSCNLAPGLEREQNPFLVQVIAANGNAVLKEIKPMNHAELLKDNVTSLYTMDTNDVKRDTNPFYNITDVTDMVVPPRTEESSADYLVRLKQFGRRPDSSVIKTVLRAATRMDYLTASPPTLI